MRYVWRNGKFVHPSTNEPMDLPERGICAPQVISDIAPYSSPLGTGVIDGRSARREDLKRSGCRAVDPSEFKPVFTSKKGKAFARRYGLNEA